LLGRGHLTAGKDPPESREWEAHETNDPTDPIGNIRILKRFLSTLSMAM
jgi:hypothetical protein